jgi:hypothetical protein
MKSIIAVFFTILLITSCGDSPKNIVNPLFTDSLINNYQPSVTMQTADSNLAFWKKRMDSLPDNFVNGPKYAAVLSSYFHLYGNINDLRKADSLMKCSNEANQQKEPGIFRSLASLAMLQHQFQEADSFLKRAVQIDGRSIPNTYLDFDVAFELGQYARAKNLLRALITDNSYGYLFRRSKYEHYDGSLDSAISCMMQAANKAGNNKYLQQVALSNAADLNIHKGSLSTAYNLYVQSIKNDPADFHSIMGLGWIALVHDKNDTLAERIFQFVHKHTYAPDALLKLDQVAEARGDSVMQKKYADEFVNQAGNSVYGKMYNKYLIDLYTGILNNPAKAVHLAELETNSRPAPQIFAWYAWSLFCNNQKDKAYEIFKGFVSKKPLEGLELYYMGKMMQGLNKGYNAQQFFKAAYKNRYDLSPAKVKDLEKNLE